MKESFEVKKALCMWCKGECGVLVHVKNGRLISVEEDPSFPRKVFPPSKTCVRRTAAKEFAYHPERVKYPLKREGERGEGKWQKISWQKAFNEIADKLERIREKYGPEALAVTIGTYRTCIEYISRFLNLFGTPNVLGQSQICFGPRSVMAKAIVGMFPHYSVSAQTKCIVLLGIEPSVARPITYYHIREARKRGAKLIVIDPRRTFSAGQADIWLRLRPGTDCALLVAMINVIINEGIYNKDFVDRWCYGFEKLRERVKEYPPEKVERITNVPAEMIKEAARLYAKTRPGVIIEGMGVEQQQNNAQILHARWILAALTGNIDVEGGEVLYGPHPQFISDWEIELIDKLTIDQRKKQLGSDKFKLFSWSGYEVILKAVRKVWPKPGGTAIEECKAHAPTVYRAIITGKPYPIKALITVASNPLVTQANTKLVLEALKKLELYVVIDHFITPSAELADYVLPATCWLERPQLSTFMGFGNYIVAGEAALPKSIPGEYDYRTDYDIFKELGVSLGQEEYWPWKTLEEAYDYRLEPLGLTFKDFIRKGRYLPVKTEYKKYEKTGFGTQTGKVELYSTILEHLGYDPLPNYEESRETIISNPRLAEKFPLTLITGGRIREYYHSEWRQVSSVRRLHPFPIVQIHPNTARKYGIRDGDWVWIETSRGRTKQLAKLTDIVPENIVNAEHGWWYPEIIGKEPLQRVLEPNINLVTDDDPLSCNQILGSWPLRTALCKIYKAE